MAGSLSGDQMGDDVHIDYPILNLLIGVLSRRQDGKLIDLGGNLFMVVLSQRASRSEG
jgi:hypothetical protein